MIGNIKQVKYEWTEIFQTDMEIAFKITCAIECEDGRIVEASEVLKIHKGITVTINPGSQSGVNFVEMSALNSAKQILNGMN